MVVCWYEGCAEPDHTHGPMPPQILTMVACQEEAPDGTLYLAWIDERLLTCGRFDPYPVWAADPNGGDGDHPSFWAFLGVMDDADVPPAEPTEPELPGGNLPN